MFVGCDEEVDRGEKGFLGGGPAEQAGKCGTHRRNKRFQGGRVAFPRAQCDTRQGGDGEGVHEA
jgi:hypothetical protein